MTKNLTIAIDGHSSTGKSTVAKSVAKMLGYTYIDSGAMYRAVTYYCLKNGLIYNGCVNEQRLAQLLPDLEIHFTFDTQKEQYLTWLNQTLVEEPIRQLEVSNHVSLVSKIGFVRERLVALQQAMGLKGGIVMDGRDIGTVVFPNAEVKIFMTASAQVRAQRRFDELVAKGEKVNFDEVKANIEMRDHIDQNRDISPLVQAPDAVVLDNSYLTREEQLQFILDLVSQKTNN